MRSRRTGCTVCTKIFAGVWRGGFWDNCEEARCRPRDSSTQVVPRRSGAFGKVFPLKVGVAGVIDGVCVEPNSVFVLVGLALHLLPGAPQRGDRPRGRYCTPATHIASIDSHQTYILPGLFRLAPSHARNTCRACRYVPHYTPHITPLILTAAPFCPSLLPLPNTTHARRA
jgi:hypothetical protein